MRAICLIGLGEVGAILAEDIGARAALSAWDLQFADPDSRPSQTLAARGMRAGKHASDAAAVADIVISAVTAAQTCAAARDVAAGLKPGAFFLDLNSASPASKIEAAKVIEAVGARYVEGAVMAPVPPARLATPILLGGPHAEEFQPLARDLGFSATRFFHAEYGRASAAKLCRSVIVKGVVALLIVSLVSAQHYGVAEDVIASLSNMFPGPDWPKLSRYMISRAIEHGVRRAEEMREAARTVSDAGLSPLMSEACAARQDWAAAALMGVSDDTIEDLLSNIRATIEERT
jgi:3-hydroxyisobutyrate dehydrogenase-like beta-hydroxyacid dehydrogenase